MFFPLVMTGRVCLKSPPRTTVMPPNCLFAKAWSLDDIISRSVKSSASKQCLWFTGASSHIMEVFAGLNWKVQPAGSPPIALFIKPANSVSLSQQFSWNNVFQPSFRPANEAYKTWGYLPPSHTQIQHIISTWCRETWQHSPPYQKRRMYASNSN